MLIRIKTFNNILLFFYSTHFNNKLANQTQSLSTTILVNPLVKHYQQRQPTTVSSSSGVSTLRSGRSSGSGVTTNWSSNANNINRSKNSTSSLGPILLNRQSSVCTNSINTTSTTPPYGTPTQTQNLNLNQQQQQTSNSSAQNLCSGTNFNILFENW